jgi:hypothetical protein
VFATTAQEVLGSCIFLFVKHPFDVLDRVDIGDDQLVVKHISLMFTVFKHVNTHKLTQVPNIVLNTLWIQNVSRSEAMREQLSIYIDFGTTLEDVQILRNEMQAFVMNKENSRDFQPDIDVEITGIAEMNKMELKVEIRHKSNWSNETIRAARRSKFMCALVLALRKIPINAPGGGGAVLGSVDQPSYTVAVSDAHAAENRDAFAEAKDAKRLVPAQKPDASTKNATRGVASGIEANKPLDSVTSPPLRYRQAPASESLALNSLNSRHPAADTAHDPTDLVEPTTPKSLDHPIAGTETPPEFDSSVSIEEVRGMLRRQSTRGKRRPSVGTSKFPQGSGHFSSALPPPPATPSMMVDYDPYSHHTSMQSAQSSPQSVSSFPQPPPSILRNPPTSAPQIPEMFQMQRQQQPPPTPQWQQPRQAPTIPLPDRTLNTENLVPSRDSNATHRAASPVRNPFQIKALESQAQGFGPVPAVQTRRPVPGSGSDSMVRPPRGDSLPAPRE